MRAFSRSRTLAGLFIIWLMLTFTRATLAAPTPAAAGNSVNDIDTQEPFTVAATWKWHDDGVTDEILLAGMATRNATESFVDLVAKKEPAAWFPTWQLELRNNCSQTSAHGTTNLAKLSVTNAALLKAVLSYQPQDKLLSVALYNLTTSETIFADAFACAPPADSLAPTILASIPNGPTLQSVEQLKQYQPVSDRYDVGERQDDGTFISLRSFDRDGSGLVTIASPMPAPGAYRISLVWPQKTCTEQDEAEEHKRVVLALIEPIKAKNEIAFSLSSLQPGAVDLAIEYIDADNTQTVYRTPLMIGKVTALLTIHGVNPEKNAVVGAVQTETIGSLPGIDIQIFAQYYRLEWNPASFAYDEIPWGSELEVLSQPVAAASATTFSVPLPEKQGDWKLRVWAKTKPEIATISSPAEEYINNKPAAPDNLVAITDQLHSGIKVFDLAVKDWNSPEAVKWSWTPTVQLGYSFLEISRLTGPADVKLRNNDVWGGQWVGVTGGGLATVAAYPTGSRKWATFIESGANPHAIELLPNGNVAVAASTGGWVRVYTASQGPNSAIYAQYNLPGAHGVLWDPTMEALWAVGDYLLVALKVTGPDSKPTLTEIVRSQLPTPWGHDLSPVYGDADRLWVSSGSRVYQYIKSSNRWLTNYINAAQISMAAVKAVGNFPSGQVVISRPKAGTLYEWTTDTVEFFRPRESRTIKGTSFYKARVWNPEYQ